MACPVSRHEEEAELKRVLASETFAKAQSLSRLLRYLCNQYFEGRACDLKEYNIGVEVLGRPANFDPATNSIVRVELHRVREKLKRHYETEGLHSPVVISLEPGKYSPRFLARADRPIANASPGVASSNGGAEEQGVEVARPCPTSAPGCNATVAGAASDVTSLVTPALAVTSPVTANVAKGTASTPETKVLPSEPAKPSTKQTSAAEHAGHDRSVDRFLVPLLTLALFSIVMVLAWKWGLFSLSPAPSRATSVFEDASVAANSGAMEQIRILAGYSKSRYIDRSGNVWDPDRFYAGGRAVSSPPQIIDRTFDPTLYQNCRAGDFSYDIPLKPGVYELRLYFAETTYGPNTLAGGGESSRIFNVDLNGRRILSEFDPLADAGANDTADVRVFDDVTPAPDGRLHLHFSKYQGPTPSQDEPILNALQITPGIPGKMRPVLIVAQNNSYTDHAGRVWVPDLYSSQGRMVLHNHLVEGTADPGLYYGERFGHFSYAIPVAKGKYALTLRFAETYFGPQNPGGGGVGSRIFDVYCNGLLLMHNLDICKEAGGPNRALVKTFHNLEANAQGKLLLTFVPIKNYACVNAVEVNSED